MAAPWRADERLLATLLAPFAPFASFADLLEVTRFAVLAVVLRDFLAACLLPPFRPFVALLFGMIFTPFRSSDKQSD
jgi:hypothetical protein